MRLCPVCQETLLKRTIHDVEADGCPSCGGVWLDAGELKALSRSREGLEGLDAAYQQAAIPLEESSRRLCPQCQVPMRQVEFDAFRGVRLDNCPRCDGLWLDHGEATAIADRLLPRKTVGTTGTTATSAGRDSAPGVQGVASGLERALDGDDVISFWIDPYYSFAERLTWSLRTILILDKDGTPVGRAEEQEPLESASFFERYNRRRDRFFDLHVVDGLGRKRLVLHRPFSLIMDSATLSNGGGQEFGGVGRTCHIIVRTIYIRDELGRDTMSVKSSLLHPWTFSFVRDGKTVATFQKTSVDVFNHGKSFRLDLTGLKQLPDERRLVFCATLFILQTFFVRLPF